MPCPQVAEQRRLQRRQAEARERMAEAQAVARRLEPSAATPHRPVSVSQT
jgi:hypothetical protein